MVSQRQVRVPSYTRTVPLITVEFVCQRCQRPQVVTMYPGPCPKWCLTCFPDVRKHRLATANADSVLNTSRRLTPKLVPMLADTIS